MEWHPHNVMLSDPYMIFVIFSPRTKFRLNFSPHTKCVNSVKTGSARKLILRQNCINSIKKDLKAKHCKLYYLFALYISNFSTSKLSPHLRCLHMTKYFSTDIVRGVRDKYHAWFPAVFMFSLQENLEVSMSRMKTQLAEKEEKMRNYERLLHEVTQPGIFVLNYHCA